MALFTASTFIVGLYVSRELRVGDVRILPLVGESMWQAEAGWFNDTLPLISIDDHIDPIAWSKLGTQQRPVAVALLPNFEGSDLDDAFQLARQRSFEVLNLLALHRQAAPEAVATFVRGLDAPRGRLYWLRQVYRGNLLGGFIAGEDEQCLLDHDKAAVQYPVLRHWLELYRTANSEPRPLFAFGRYWLVLEDIASERIQAGVRVTDFGGDEITDQDATTGRARGRVYALLVARASSSRGAGINEWPGPSGESLWDLTGVWLGYRNAAEHHGGFSVHDLQQQTQRWFGPVNAAEQFAGAAGTAATLMHPYLQVLREAAWEILHWELDAAAGYWNPNG